MGGEKKTNGDANQVDEEHNPRASIFLAINPLMIKTPGSILSQRVWDRIMIYTWFGYSLLS